MPDNINRIYGVPTSTDVERYKGVRYQSPDITNSYYIGNQANAGIMQQRVLDPNRVVNPPFDPRIWAQPAGRGSVRPRLLRGRMTHLKAEPVSIPGTNGAKFKRSLNFLWNPTAVTHGYSFDSSSVPAGERVEGDKGIILQQGQSVGFNLIFNRTYEVAYGSNHPGVLVDTQALDYMLGTYDGGAIGATDVLVVFGATDNNRPFAFTGWITDCSVEYLQFSHRMIPTVAVVKITLARRTFANSTGTGVQGVGVTGTGSNPGVIPAANSPVPNF